MPETFQVVFVQQANRPITKCIAIASRGERRRLARISRRVACLLAGMLGGASGASGALVFNPTVDLRASNNPANGTGWTNLGTAGGTLQRFLDPSFDSGPPPNYSVHALDGSFNGIQGSSDASATSGRFSVEIYLNRTGDNFGGGNNEILQAFSKAVGNSRFTMKLDGGSDTNGGLDLRFESGSVVNQFDDVATLPLHEYKHIVVTFW